MFPALFAPIAVILRKQQISRKEQQEEKYRDVEQFLLIHTNNFF